MNKKTLENSDLFRFESRRFCVEVEKGLCQTEVIQFSRQNEREWKWQREVF